MLSKKGIGTFDGKIVEEVTLESAAGVRVSLMNWGVVVRDWQVSVCGKPRSVVLGFETFDPYPVHSPYFGALVGRVANRIDGAQFTLDGKTYRLPANDGANHLHGGPQGLSLRIWEMEPDSATNAIKFSLTSSAGEMGYPGTVRFEAYYTLVGSRLRLDLSALPDAPTPINMTQHNYFNLTGSDTALDHMVHLPSAVAHTAFRTDHVPTGAILPVNGTDLDFRSPRRMRQASGRGVDYNVNYVLAMNRKLSDPVATVTGEDGALALRLFSDQPTVQFYNGFLTDVPAKGHHGRHYGKYSGLCLEDQFFPDAVNHLHFPSIICSPDAPYRHWCEFDISPPKTEPDAHIII